MRLVCECVSEEEGRSEAQKGWFMFRGGRVLGWGTSGHLGSDVTAGGVSEGGAWTSMHQTDALKPHAPTSATKFMCLPTTVDCWRSARRC